MAVNTIETVAILGGGTAGWMTASALAKSFPGKLKIILVESEEIGIVGVGEATVPSINVFNAAMGFDVPHFMRACDATFKLGIEFVDWGAVGRRYMHPFTNFGTDVTRKDFASLWMQFAKYQQEKGIFCAIDDYNLACLAASQGKFILPEKGKPVPVGPMRYAFHFDAALYARFLRSHAEKLGVTRVEGKAISVCQDVETGFIKSIVLDGGAVVTADFFVDCSGFQGVLIEKTLKTGYDNWKHWLPCDRAVAVPSQNVTPLAPFTHSTADRAGWRWRIPLQNRTGNGHVYASDFMSDDEAERRLIEGLEGPALAVARRLSFVTGKRRKIWSHNCVAIGLSSGFLEPLESTSIYMIQTGIVRLMRLFSDMGYDRKKVTEYNRLCTEEFETIRDFLILHYKLSVRDDSEFWRHCRHMSVPDAVTANLEQFARTGQVAIPPNHPFPVQGWLSVMLGQGGLPQGLEALPSGIDIASLDAYMQHTRNLLQQTVAPMPAQQDFLSFILQVRPGQQTPAA